MNLWIRALHFAHARVLLLFRLHAAAAILIFECCSTISLRVILFVLHPHLHHGVHGKIFLMVFALRIILNDLPACGFAVSIRTTGSSF